MLLKFSVLNHEQYSYIALTDLWEKLLVACCWYLFFCGGGQYLFKISEKEGFTLPQSGDSSHLVPTPSQSRAYNHLIRESLSEAKSHHITSVHPYCAWGKDPSEWRASVRGNVMNTKWREQTRHHYGAHNDYAKNVRHRCSRICHISGISLHLVVIEGDRNTCMHTYMQMCLRGCVCVHLCDRLLQVSFISRVKLSARLPGCPLTAI